MKYLLPILLLGLVLPSAATGQETAHAILACKVRRVDATYLNPRNPSELRLMDPRLDIVIGFTAVDSRVDVAGIRLFDPARVLADNRITELSWNSQTHGFVITTEERGEGPVSLVISGPEAGMTTFPAIVVRLGEAAVRRPLAYMFNGRCGLMPTRDPLADFDRYIAALGSVQ